MNSYESPVLFLVFNRPYETAKVFEAIRQYGPKKLYISADGARESVVSDTENCNTVKQIVSKIDWKCDVKYHYNTDNHGCKYAVSNGINWFFDHEEMGIILEDDTLPSNSFFRFCSDLLDKYKFDTRVMKISGYNLLSDKYLFPYDYFFSRYSFSWGWATWKRAWEMNDLEMDLWPTIKELGFSNYLPFDDARNSAFEDVVNGLDTWDYQWDFTMACQNGLQIVPSKSLIQNIGFNDSATHTKEDYQGRGKVISNDLNYPIRHHPNFILPNSEYEILLNKEVVKSERLLLMKKLIKRIKPH